MNKIFVIACFAIGLFSARGIEAQNVEKKSWEIHIKLGSQTYLNELDPDPGSASLGGFLIGYNLSDRSMIGLHSASAIYQIQYIDGTTDEEYVNSFLLIYRHRFRVQKALQPYLEAGLGSADPIIGYDTGSKPAFTFASVRYGASMTNGPSPSKAEASLGPRTTPPTSPKSSGQKESLLP